MLIKLSSIDHPVTSVLWDVKLQSSAKARGTRPTIHGSDLRSEILLRNMSKITIVVKTGGVELFEQFRDTSIGILNLKMAEGASFASESIPTLNMLTKLQLSGTYTSRCFLQLPFSLQFISLLGVICLFEWLYSLLITLSSIDHLVVCEMCDVLMQASAEIYADYSNRHVSSLRLEILSHDISKISIVMNMVSIELFELLRGTNIGNLCLKALIWPH
ncbi:hypothetical protein DPMN_067856 [Dreissena polymorpha]|uniref:Uncharacterized protein n=1 Tax=Dreissena polymorpha TaxID=45954 RepID=A0A9D4BLP2_DREPO|nr:hypothetical protein DPMN_067856 [Dreissena polymorpha]